MDKYLTNGKIRGKIIKKRSNCFCNVCGKELPKNTEIICAEKSDGYTVKKIGFSHLECFNNFK